MISNAKIIQILRHYLIYACPITIMYVLTIGPTLNPLIGNIVDVETTIWENSKSYVITTTDNIKVHVSHYGEIPYQRPRSTIMYAIYQNGKFYNGTDLMLKLQLPDSITTSPVIYD